MAKHKETDSDLVDCDELAHDKEKEADPVDANLEEEPVLEENIDFTDDLPSDLEANHEKPPEIDPSALGPTQIYLNEIGYSPLLSAEEELYYARRIAKGDQDARRRMIESNLRLVVKIARHYYNR